MATPSRKLRREPDTTVRTSCEHCGAALVADLKDAGKKATCPGCGTRLIIPDQGVAPRVDLPARRKPVSERTRPREEPPAPPPEPIPEPAAVPAAPAGAVLTLETHRMRSKVAGWLRRVVIVALALTVIKIFEACFSSVLVSAPADVGSDFHSTVFWLLDAIKSIPAGLRYLTIERPENLDHRLLPIERLMLGLGMLIYATRLVVRTKLLDTVYVTTVRWHERTLAGLVMHFLAALLLAGMLAWTASATRDPGVSDGLVCGLLAATLWASAIWLTTLHLVAGNEYPELTKWMATDALFGFLVLLATLWPDLTVLWSRAGAVAVLLLADSAVSLHVGASFVFARRPRRWWWRKPLTIVVSVILLFLVAALLACAR